MRPFQKFLANSLVVGCCVLAGGGAAHAVTITYVGSVEGTEVTDWRTSSTTKSFDVDGDNVYGTFGAIHFTVASENIHPTGSTNPGFSYINTTGGQFTNAGYSDVDHITNAPTNTDAGLKSRSFRFSLTGDANTYVDQRVRIGIMNDILAPTEYAADNLKALRVVGVNTTGNSGDISLRGGAAGNGVPEMYFFDITGMSAGDQFEIIGSINGVDFGTGAYVGPVSFDIVEVPEPSGVLLCGLAVTAGLITRRRSSPA